MRPLRDDVREYDGVVPTVSFDAVAAPRPHDYSASCSECSTFVRWKKNARFFCGVKRDVSPLLLVSSCWTSLRDGGGAGGTC